MAYVSARDGARLVLRLRRNGAALIMAGGRLPDARCWIEGIDPPGGVRQPDAWRWQVVCASGWTNIGSRWPVRLVMNADHLDFRSDGDGNVSVEIL